MGQTYDHNHEGTSESPPEKEPEKINPHTQKLSPFVNEKLTLDLCIQKVQEEFNNYNDYKKYYTHT